MKMRRFLFTAGVATLLVAGVTRVQASYEVSANLSIHAKADFYEPLTAHGSWVEVGSYGRCWHPTGIAVEWRPYCCGYWEWTDCGWYWVSDEPWAWACYHYGSWIYDDTYGWVWVPDIEWAPAWVFWRSGGGYIGWAPCPPHRWLFAAKVNTSAFVFVDAGHVCDPVRPNNVIINNQSILKKTVEFKNVRRENRSFDGGSTHRVVINEGPGIAVVEKASGKKFAAISIRDADRRTSVPDKLQRDKPKSIIKSDLRTTPDKVKPAAQPKPVPVNPIPAPDKRLDDARQHNPTVQPEVIPTPGHPPGPDGPPPSHGQEGEHERGKDRGHDGQDRH